MYKLFRKRKYYDQNHRHVLYTTSWKEIDQRFKSLQSIRNYIKDNGFTKDRYEFKISEVV